jgi:hypothetical protein
MPLIGVYHHGATQLTDTQRLILNQAHNPPQEPDMPIQRHYSTPPPTAEHIIGKVATAHGWETIKDHRNYIHGDRTLYHNPTTWITVEYTDNATRAVKNALRTTRQPDGTTTDDKLTGREKGKRETILDWLMGLA